MFDMFGKNADHIIGNQKLIMAILYLLIDKGLVTVDEIKAAYKSASDRLDKDIDDINNKMYEDLKKEYPIFAGFCDAPDNATPTTTTTTTETPTP